MPRTSQQAAARHNLPSQATSFVGRTEEIATIAARLDDAYCRLLTLLGPGGIGKTRLALEVAASQLDRYADGVYFVGLQSVSDPDFIVPTIIGALGLSPQGNIDLDEQVLDYLRERQLLLVLDNFEHLLSGADLLTRILTSAPEVKLLVTSREALNLREEWVHHVEEMRYPSDEQLEAIESYSAVQLFAERARQVQKRFSLTDERACVVRICQLVEGMPLGIELATAWLKTLPCRDIAAALEHNLDFLATIHRNTPLRHGSMRAVFNHSWELLSGEEQDLFMKLSVFWGSFEREAAEHVAGASLLGLSSLADKSMLRVNRSGRYEIHELLRQFGDERLSATGTSDDLRDAHCAYYLNFLHQREADLKGRRQLEGLNELAPEFENIRMAWYWAVDQKHYDLIDGSMKCLRLFCNMRNRWLEGKALLRHARESMTPQPGEKTQALWGRLLTREASFRNFVTSPEDVLQAEQGLAIARQFGSLQDEAFSLFILGQISVLAPVFDEAITYAEQSLELYRTLDDKFYIVDILGLLALYYRKTGRRDKSIPLWRQSRDLARAIGTKNQLAYALMWLANDTFHETGDYHEAGGYWQESYAIRREISQPDGVAASASALSDVALFHGDYKRARALANEALKKVSSSRGGWGGLAEFAQRTLALLALAEEDYDEAWRLSNESRPTDRSDPLSRTDLRLAMICCGLRDFRSARKHLRAGLESIEVNCAPPFLTNVLPPAALILAHEGQTEWATQLLGLAFTYPGTHVGMMATWPLMTRCIAHLEAELGADAYAAAWELGASQDLGFVIATLSEQFGVAGDTVEIPPVNQELIEPLSARELEVLELIADGLSNREIGAELVVTVGTVKKHINNIFGKLHVGSRTQAVARGRSLNLLS